jgi:hypothetical protein
MQPPGKATSPPSHGVGLDKATEEFWPGRGWNPGLPNETPALYPLLRELALGMVNY